MPSENHSDSADTARATPPTTTVEERRDLAPPALHATYLVPLLRTNVASLAPRPPQQPSVVLQTFTQTAIANPDPSSVSDADVLRDAEAYLLGKSGESSTDQTEARNEKETVRVAALPLVCLNNAVVEDVRTLHEIFSASWAEETVGSPADTQFKRCSSVKLSCGKEREELAHTTAIGPAAPYAVTREDVDGTVQQQTRAVTSAVVSSTLPRPLLAASAEEEAPDCGPVNWMAYGGAAARAMATRTAAGATEMAAAQVPGGSAAVAAARKGATVVSETRAAATAAAAAATATATTAAATPAATSSSSPSFAGVAAPLRSTSGYARTAATEAATRRQRQLQLYVTQNFVPTLSDFVPGANAVAERVAVKARTLVTTRVGRGQAEAVAVTTAEAEVRVGAPAPAGAALRVEAEAQCRVCEAGCGSENRHDVNDAEQHTTVQTATEVHQKEHISGAPCSTRTTPGHPPQPEDVAARSASSRKAGGGVVPYATLRVFLFRSDGGTRNGNDPVEAVAKFGRMPCKRKVQELLSNFAYNLLPRAPDLGQKNPPYREMLVLQAQQVWSGTPVHEAKPTEAADPSSTTQETRTSFKEGEPFPILRVAGAIRATAAAGASAHISAATDEATLLGEAGDGRDSPSTSVVVNPLSPSAVARRYTRSHGTNVEERRFSSSSSSSAAAAYTEDDKAASLTDSLPNKATYHAYMAYDHHTVLHNARYGAPSLRPWSRECPCCCSPAACREGCCCLHCQMARQCNMLNYQRPTVLWTLCCLVVVLDPCTCFACSSLLACVNRATVRARYGIEGCFLGDCLCALLCTRCSTAQVMEEMLAHGEYPGGFCMLPPLASPTSAAMS